MAFAKVSQIRAVAKVSPLTKSVTKVSQMAFTKVSQIAIGESCIWISHFLFLFFIGDLSHQCR